MSYYPYGVCIITNAHNKKRVEKTNRWAHISSSNHKNLMMDSIIIIP